MLGEIIQFDTNWKASLQFRHQIARIHFVEGSSGNKQNMICFHIAELGLDRGTFHDWQQVTLNTLSGYIGSLGFTGNDLVNFIEEDDAYIFGKFDCLSIDFFRLE